MSGSASQGASPDRYVAPTRLGAIVNRAAGWLVRHGIGLFGARVLSVPGRVSGRIQQIPVNLLELDGRRYLVAVRGNTQWVRNVRAGGPVTLSVGRRHEPVALVEMPAGQTVPVLRRYLARWGWEVGQFVDGLSANSTAEELLAAAPGLPVFEVLPDSR